MRSTKIGIMLFLIFISFNAFSGVADGKVFIKDNGVIKVKLNEYNIPIITSMYVDGDLIVPHDNTGADFSMTSRSVLGDAYNPTQGGDCRGNPSELTGYIERWSGTGLNISANNGILLGIKPRNYNEPPTGCQGAGILLPHKFNFGITLGDGISLPKQAMILDMSIFTESDGQFLTKRLSELPAIFPDSTKMRYAFYSLDGVNFLPLHPEDNLSNDVLTWGYGVGIDLNAKAIMLSNTPFALVEPNGGVGIAIYSNFTAVLGASSRFGGRPLVALGITGESSQNSEIQMTKNKWYTVRRVVAVGNFNSIKETIRQANVKIHDWGTWLSH